MTGSHRVALSTMWFQRWPDARGLEPFLEAAKGMGFEAIELSHILPPPLVDRLDPRPAGLDVVAVHHPCPRPSTVRPSDHAFSADAAARGRWVADVRRSIETADRLGASSVVIHLGRYESEHVRRAAFERVSRVRAGQGDTPRGRRSLEDLKEGLRDAEADGLERAADALCAVESTARSSGIKIGIETGYHPWEAPTIGGMSRLLEMLDSPLVGPWLDTGHAAARGRTGLADLDDWRERFAAEWVGVHLHDIVGFRDHLAPGMGTIDFAAVGRSLPRSAVRTLEVDWYLEPGEITAGIKHVIRTGCDPER